MLYVVRYHLFLCVFLFIFFFFCQSNKTENNEGKCSLRFSRSSYQEVFVVTNVVKSCS